jgi:hypothetical protein
VLHVSFVIEVMRYLCVIFFCLNGKEKFSDAV